MIVIATLLAIFLLSAVIAGLYRARPSVKVGHRIGTDWSFLWKPPMVVAWLFGAIYAGVMVAKYLGN